jgi:response regulator of citrate/malate metabolism
MISSVSEKREIMACLKLGIQGYILKPFHAKTLAETVLQYHRKAKAAAKPQNGKSVAPAA